MRELVEGDDAPINDQLSGKVIGAAIAVHRTLGPGFLEAVYARALRCELTAIGVPWSAEVEVPILYRGTIVGRHRLDLVVAHELVLELKSCGRLDAVHFAQVRSYLAASGLHIGLLLNFEQTTLTIRRVVDQSLKLRLRGSGVSAPTQPRATYAAAETAPTPIVGP